MQAYEPIDKIALYGQDPINALQVSGTHYVATGGGRQNATGGVIAGRVISDQILGITNPWTKVCFTDAHCWATAGSCGSCMHLR